MTLHSEIMTCDFNSGMELVSDSEIVPNALPGIRPHQDSMSPSNRALRPQPPPHHPTPQLPPGWRGSARSGPSTYFEVLNSGMRHNPSPGETRIKIDYSRVVSFFDPALSSLVEARTGKDREEFRLDEISEVDTEYVLDHSPTYSLEMVKGVG